MKFSIAIPAYKRKYLGEAIQSCLSQSYSDYEIIIVNDASPEDLDSVVSKFNDNRIRYYVNKKNCGAVDVVDNWNICLGYATGDYLICMGDDDRLLPNCLADYKQLIEKYPRLGVYHGRTEIIDDESAFYSVTEARPEYEGVYSLIWHRWMGGREHQYIGDFAYNISNLRAHGGFYKLPLAWASDDISAVIAASLGGIANTQAVVFQYRVNPYTISNTGNIKMKLNAILEEEMWYKEFFKRQRPSNSIEEAYSKSTLRIYNMHFREKKKNLLFQQLKEHGWGTSIFWLAKKKKLGLSFMDILKQIIKSGRF